MPTEFFVCSCPDTGNVILDGNDQGPNRDSSGTLLPMQCGTGLHTIALKCPAGKTCKPPQITMVIEDTNPATPKEVPFQCQ